MKRLQLDAFALLGGLEEHAFLLDREWRILFLNDRARSRFSAMQDLPGRDFRRVLEEAGAASRELRLIVPGVDAPGQGEIFLSGLDAWVAIRTIPCRGEEGPLLVVLLRDVSDRWDAATATNAADGEALAILDAGGDAFYTIDRHWRLTYLNARVEELWGGRRDDMLGRALGDVLPGYVGSPAHRELVVAMAERRSVTFEAESYSTGNWIEVNCRPHRDGLLVYFHNIVARKHAEQALREARTACASPSRRRVLAPGTSIRSPAGGPGRPPIRRCSACHLTSSPAPRFSWRRSIPMIGRS